MRNPITWIGEQFSNQWYDVTRGLAISQSFSALRSVFSGAFFARPAMQNTRVNMDLARSLYRNDNLEYNLGAGFVRPIIDLCVEYMELPNVTSDNGDRDTWLNDCIHEHWGADLLAVWRDLLRDSKVVIRFRQPRTDNPLFTQEDREKGKIEIIPPEMVDITWDPTDPDLIERAVITHFIEFDERTQEEMQEGKPPRVKEHEILEFITPEAYSFWDKTEHRNLDSWGMPNKLRFVPLIEGFNEYAADLAGGQSDIEPVLPFIQQFHEVLLQALSAHKYHSIPKAKFNLKDVQSFLRNNFPQVLDEAGKLKEGATINWTGREIFLFSADEDGGFIEAKNELGGSVELLGFLIDCIAIAAETPKWALLKDAGTNTNDASVQPFEKKVLRKRTMVSPIIVMLAKMVEVANGRTPNTVRVTWPAVRLTDLAAKGQAIQQLIMGFDVATAHEWIADETVIQILGGLFAEMNSPNVEKRLAARNVVPEIPAPAPASDTQASQNGSGQKSSAKKALATTSASNS